MNTLNVISIPFYEFTADEALTDSVLEDVKKTALNQKGPGGNMFGYGNDNSYYFHSELFDFFDKCLLEVKEKLSIKSDIDLPITMCWVNKMNKLQHHHPHEHANSIFSGIFYLTTQESSITNFIFPNPWFDRLRDPQLYCFDSEGSGLPKNLPTLSGKVKPVKGKLLLFPSGFTHNVTPLVENNERYSIAFNTYVSGNFASIDEKTIFLQLKAKSVRDRVEENKAQAKN